MVVMVSGKKNRRAGLKAHLWFVTSVVALNQISEVPKYLHLSIQLQESESKKSCVSSALVEVSLVHIQTIQNSKSIMFKTVKT